MFLGLWRGVHPQRLPSCLQGCPLHRNIDLACVLEKTGNEKHAHLHKSWGGRLRGERLPKHVFALYNLPIIFFKNILARYARSIPFYHPLKKCKHAMCIFFIFGVFISDSEIMTPKIKKTLTASFRIQCKTCLNDTTGRSSGHTLRHMTAIYYRLSYKL